MFLSTVLAQRTTRISRYEFTRAVYPLLATAIGMLGWNGEAERLVLLIAAPAVMSRADRTTAMVTATAYYLAANRGVVCGTTVYFDTSIAVGVTFWIAVAVINALPWALLHSQRRSSYWWRIPVILLITAVPPLGVVGLGHPLSAAGMLYPGWGFLGVVATVVLMIAIALRRIVPTSTLLACALLSSTACAPSIPRFGIGIDTQFGGTPHDIETATAYAHNRKAAQDAADILRHGQISVVVLPESTAGLWTISREAVWHDIAELAQKQTQTVAVGAQRLIAGGGYENGMMLMGKGGFQFAAQRIPIPIAMWRPWANNGAAAHWFSDGIVHYGDARIGYLICYEQFLIWPVMLTAYEHPDIVIGMANMWWAKGTDIPYLQHAAMTAWARLFRWPIVTATNL